MSAPGAEQDGTPSPQDELEARCAAYALGALEPAERAALEAELARDPAARALAQDLERAAHGLALALTPVTPSSGLRARILAGIEGAATRHHSLPPFGTRPSGFAAGSPIAASPRPGRDEPELDLEELLLAQRTRIVGGVAALFAALAALLGVAFADAYQARRRAEVDALEVAGERSLLQGELDAARAALATARDAQREGATKVEGLEARVGELEVEVADLAEVARLLRDRETRVFELAANGAARSASGRVLLSGTGREVVFMADHLSALGEGKTWQLWTIEEGRAGPRPVGLFGAPGATGALDVAPLHVDPRAVKKFAVSLEPAGGAPGPGPSGEIVLISP